MMYFMLYLYEREIIKKRPKYYYVRPIKPTNQLTEQSILSESTEFKFPYNKIFLNTVMAHALLNLLAISYFYCGLPNYYNHQ